MIIGSWGNAMTSTTFSAIQNLFDALGPKRGEGMMIALGSKDLFPGFADHVAGLMIKAMDEYKRPGDTTASEMKSPEAGASSSGTPSS